MKEEDAATCVLFIIGGSPRQAALLFCYYSPLQNGESPMTTATQAAPTTDSAAGFRDLLVKQLEQEMKTTKRVLAAVPDGKRDYRPDPHGRTAAELAEHIALTDVQFLQGINDLGFE